MKNLTVRVLAVCLISTAAIAETEGQSTISSKDPKMYLGLDYFKGNTDFDVSDDSDSATFGRDQKGFRLKGGLAIKDDLRVQGYIKKEETEKELDLMGITFSKEIIGFGGDLVKSFSGFEPISPFVQIGGSLDWRDVESIPGVELSQDVQLGMALKLGIGAKLKLAHSAELVSGFDLQYRTWQDIEFEGAISDTLSITDISKSFYLGANFFF